MPLFIAFDKEYDGNSFADFRLCSLEGVIDSEQVNLQIDRVDFATKNVGSNIPVIPFGVRLTGRDASNYSVNPNEISYANITTRKIYGKFLAKGKKFDGTSLANVDFTNLINVVPFDDVKLVINFAVFQSSEINLDIPVIPISFFLTGSDAINYSLVSILPSKASIFC